MDGFPSSIELSPSTSRILIAEYDSSMLDSLRMLNHSMPDIEFQLCTSRDQAMRKLLSSPYQAIISGVYLAETDDFLLVRQSQKLETKVPLIVTARASDGWSAREALAHGAFDVIANPLDPDESRASIRQALWHARLRRLLSAKERALERYRQYKATALLAGEKQHDIIERHLSIIRDTVQTYEETIERVEESVRLLAESAGAVERQVRARAIERLESPRK